jgi:hypothetical protein
MRIIVFLQLFILSTAIGSAQNNLILNGSFENINGCPFVDVINNGLLINCSNPANYTPDYFNICYTNLGFPSNAMGIPSNTRGYQNARTGEAYIGLDLWEKNAPARDYIQLKFNNTLKHGHHYAFTCYVNMANKFRYATANFGAYFSLDSVAMPTTDVLPFVPQIENSDSNILTDTLNWVPITGTYLANGGEQFLLLGNFKPVAEGFDTAYQYYGSPTHANWAYYYIDDVSLIDLDSTLSVNENEAMAQVEVFPNPAKESINLSGIAVEDRNGVMVSVKDITGKLVLQTKLNANIPIDVSQLHSGLYFIYLESSKGKQMAKFVKE